MAAKSACKQSTSDALPQVVFMLKNSRGPVTNCGIVISPLADISLDCYCYPGCLSFRAPELSTSSSAVSISRAGTHRTGSRRHCSSQGVYRGPTVGRYPERNMLETWNRLDPYSCTVTSRPSLMVRLYCDCRLESTKSPSRSRVDTSLWIEATPGVAHLHSGRRILMSTAALQVSARPEISGRVESACSCIHGWAAASIFTAI